MCPKIYPPIKMTVNKNFTVFPIGYIKREDEKISIKVKEKYRPGLLELDTFSHVVVVWWGHAYAQYRHQVDLQMKPPYAPDVLTGIFATRSPVRPNPVNVTSCKILGIDHEKGVLEVNQIDAFEGTPVLDLKAYFPTVDRVKEVVVPERFKTWGEWVPEEGEPPEYYE